MIEFIHGTKHSSMRERRTVLAMGPLITVKSDSGDLGPGGWKIVRERSFPVSGSMSIR
jgi:hypothetical protein